MMLSIKYAHFHSRLSKDRKSSMLSMYIRTKKNELLLLLLKHIYQNLYLLMLYHCIRNILFREVLKFFYLFHCLFESEKNLTPAKIKKGLEID